MKKKESDEQPMKRMADKQSGKDSWLKWQENCQVQNSKNGRLQQEASKTQPKKKKNSEKLPSRLTKTVKSSQDSHKTEKVPRRQTKNS